MLPEHPERSRPERGTRSDQFDMQGPAFPANVSEIRQRTIGKRGPSSSRGDAAQHRRRVGFLERLQGTFAPHNKPDQEIFPLLLRGVEFHLQDSEVWPLRTLCQRLAIPNERDRQLWDDVLRIPSVSR
jgi:hypothetical protein